MKGLGRSNMKVLLTTLNSKFIHSNLALRYLENRIIHAKLSDIEVYREEFTINNSEDYIFNEILAGEYQVICFSCYIWNIEKIVHLSKKIKMAMPNIKVVLGGPEVSFDADSFLCKHGYVDYIICGEGEIVLPKLIEDIFKERSSKELGKIIEGGIVDVANIPFPYEDGIDKNKILYYESTKGCPYRCSYCISSIDKMIRPFHISRVKKELQFFLDKGVKQVKFLDRTFNWNKERSLEIFRYLIDNDNGVTNFHFEVCAENMTEDIMRCLGKAREGLLQFEIGIQSTNVQTLGSVDRFSDVELLLSKVKSLVSMGNSHIHVDLIVGLPYETVEIFKESFNRVYNLGADAIQLGFLKLLKGTKIREEANIHEYIYDNKAPYQVIRNKYMSAMDIVRLKRVEEVLDRYYNRGGFEKSLAYLVDIYEEPFNFYDSFAEFYFDKGYQKANHKKEDNYRILNEFVESINICGDIKKIIYEDMKKRLNEDAVKRFDRKGWQL